MTMGTLFDKLLRRRGSHPYCAALVPAAGRSRRMGGADKLTALLGGEPVLHRTLWALDNARLVDEIVVAASPDRLEEIAREMVGVETVCLPLDLCDSMSFTTLQEKLAAEKPEVAILINKKGIHFKKLWRGILVLTIAVPQFISLLYVSKLFDTNGVVNAMLLKLGFIDQAIRFWENTTSARILVIVINIWVGIPYLMLVSTGILMNIPQDLYESSKIDGASVWQQYVKITLPYMLFVTGPYLLTSFISNINNFNLLYYR